MDGTVDGYINISGDWRYAGHCSLFIVPCSLGSIFEKCWGQAVTK
jgi:hypothetical protein